MVTVDMSYNPYLMQTSVLFNGKKPHINSAIEKYQNSILQNWIEKLPDIFRDEMNGYGFELKFTGTKLDFDDIKSSFAKKEVSENDVLISFKNELESRAEKLKRVDELLSWFRANPNRNFDFDVFENQFRDLFDEKFDIYVVGQVPSNMKLADTSIFTFVNVNSMDDLVSADLLNLPVLLCIPENYSESFRSDLMKAIRREDVTERQLIFVANELVDTEADERVIEDYGIHNPQIISSFSDKRLKDYIDEYTITVRINNEVTFLEKIASDLKEKLDQENRDNEVKNKGTHLRLTEINDTIESIHEASDLFENMDNFEEPQEWRSIGEKLLESISEWNKKKVKFANLSEADIASKELVTFANDKMDEFYRDINKAAQNAWQDLLTDMSEWYTNIGLEREYAPQDSILIDFQRKYYFDFAHDLLEINETKEVANNSFFGSKDKEPVPVTTYYLEPWREYVKGEVKKYIIGALSNRFKIITEKIDDVKSQFIDKLDSLNTSQCALKESVVQMLSEDEKQVQQDNDWYRNFKNQLIDIERS